MKQVVEFSKKSVNTIGEESIHLQLEKIINHSLGRTLEKQGFSGKIVNTEHEPNEKGHDYKAKVIFRKMVLRQRDNAEEVFMKQWVDVLYRMVPYARGLGWEIELGSSSDAIKAQLANIEKPQEFNIKLPEEIESHFSHIYDRNPQIRIIYNAIQAAYESNFTVRHHCLLYGAPACAKSDTLLAFENMIGAENFVRLDATSTTKAGAENLILSLNPVPPFIIIEEIEKCNLVNLPWLLGVLDQRAEIIKTTARTGGALRKSARCLCFGTVNNLQEFKNMMSGALASRFQHKIYFPRPTREVLRKILEREVERIQGKKEWIDPALDYCINVEKTNDPRRVISVLDGKDRLLTGEYQKDLQAIRQAMEQDEVEGFA
jgi:hypothetical protein